MSYLVNSTRFASVTVNGVDYSEYFVSFTCSDASANRNGLVSTTGDLVFGTYGRMLSMQDYDRNAFKRGHEVIINVSSPDLGITRHPRGLLYVISTSYDPESDQLSVQLGCKLALAALTEDISELISLVPIQLDEAQQTYANISASFATASKYLFQNNQGSLVQNYFFSGDNYASSAAGEWVSVYGTTTETAGPLQAGSAIPDLIELSYQVPADDLAGNNNFGKREITETISDYFLSYPATIFIRKPSLSFNVDPGSDDDFKKPNPQTRNNPRSSGCGNTVPVPDNASSTYGAADSPTPGGEEVDSCSEDYETKQQTTYVSVTKKTTSETVYDGYGGQVGSVLTETYGPSFEVNPQYYADKYAFCRSTNSSNCRPNGSCRMEGINSSTKQNYTFTENYYGPAGELVKVVVDNYATKLSGAIPSDYRSGEIGGENVQWTNISDSQMYRVSRQVTEYKYSLNKNQEDVYTWTSSTSRGSGISGNIDALAGIKTHERRISTTITTTPIRPDIVNTVSTSTDQRTTLILLTDQYITPPGVAGPYIVKEQFPSPVLLTNEAEIEAVVDSYTYYLRSFVLGDAYGIAIGESLRDDVIQNWRPGMPFRYYDPRSGTVAALRMDACTWGLDATSSAFATNGIWTGYSNAAISIPSNLSGNSTPDLPTSPALPTVSNETIVDRGDLYWIVDVNVQVSVIKNFWGDNGILPILPTDLTAEPGATLSIWCTGYIVSTGALLSVGANGNILLEANGVLVTEGATVINYDLFSPA